MMKINALQNNKDPNQEFDILITNFIEEGITADTKQLFYSPHENDFTWMFGKLYRKEFIQKNNIRFDPSLQVHEDTYFNALFRSYGCKIIFNQWPSYVWRFNPNSITRANDADYSYNSLSVFIEA